MATSSYRHILVHVDGSDERARSALDAAIALAETSGAKLRVVDVLRPPPGRLVRSAERDYRQLLVEGRRDALHELCRDVVGDAASWEVDVRVGAAAVEIIREVLADDVDLVVRAAEGRGVGRLFGGTDMALLRKCPCPVLIVRPGRERLRRIVAAIDPDMDDDVRESLNPAIMRTAGHLAKLHGATLDVVHAWYLVGEEVIRSGAEGLGPEQYRELLRVERRHHLEALGREIEPFGLSVDDPRVHVLKGAPTEVIPETVEQIDADLLVMGTVGRVGLPGLLIGNTAETILGRVGCAVLAIKPEGFQTPVEPASPEAPRKPGAP